MQKWQTEIKAVGDTLMPFHFSLHFHFSILHPSFFPLAGEKIMKKGVPYFFLSSTYFSAMSETFFIFPSLSLLFCLCRWILAVLVNHTKMSALVRKTRNLWHVGKSGVLHFHFQITSTFPLSDQVSLSLQWFIFIVNLISG